MSAPVNPSNAPLPDPIPETLLGKWRFDVVSGFLVFLIALPLCLAISVASGFPAIAGVFTAIVGGLIVSFISNAQLTIKGPAAGLIVIVLGCVQDFGYTGGTDKAADISAYRIALAVGVAAAAIQIFLALLRTGALAEFFPTAVVHGMLAAIGIIIISKQIPIALGVSAKGDPLELLRQLPEHFQNMNPEIALIGSLSLFILFLLPLIKNKYVKMVPGQMVVVIVAVLLGTYFDLAHEHNYTFHGHNYQLSEKYLVNVPNNLFNAFVFPDFSALATPKAWKWIVMFSLIGSIESLLSAKAVELIDPWKRKTNFDSDLLGVGVGNLIASLIGGLPMISEIVRSRANIDNGARSKWSNAFHGAFLLLFVWLAPTQIHKIPLAALAGMLIYTGFRLAHPREFKHVFQIGREQFLVFVTTIVAVLATDLLVGIGIGIALKFFIHYINGCPVRSFFKPFIDVEELTEDEYAIRVQASAVFSTWLLFKREITNIGLIGRKNLVIDLSGTRLVDHTVMEKLLEMKREFEQAGLRFQILGLEDHRSLSDHPTAVRKKKLVLPATPSPTEQTALR